MSGARNIFFSIDTELSAGSYTRLLMPKTMEKATQNAEIEVQCAERGPRHSHF